MQVAVDAGNVIYVAGSTTSTEFPVTTGAIQSSLGGAQNIFIAKITPLPPLGTPQLLYATYLGGSGTDSLAGIAVDPKNGVPNVYVAGFTTSPNFPTTPANAFQSTATFTLPNQTHGFLTKLSPATGGVYQLAYSTYVAGNGIDTVTGLAVDAIQNAYLTGVTNSTDPPSSGFPANPDGFQLASNSPGNNQFFASKINTTGTGTLSMLYSTFFGGGNPVGASAIGGGIAVDVSGNMYFTGGTNMLGVTGPNQEVKFPLFNAYQSCLNNSCTVPDSSSTDAILVKLNPSQTQPEAPPLFSTYLGGTQNDIGIAVAVDTSSNAYVTGSTNSPTSGAVDWNCVTPCILGPFGYLGVGGNTNAFIAKIGNQPQPNTIFPLNFFTYIGGSGPDSGQAIVADSVGTAHVAGTTSGNLPVFNPLTQGSAYGGGLSDAFAALISTTIATVPGQPPPAGDYLTYLGGSQSDQGTGIALDVNNTAYVVGTTQSLNFPTVNPLQSSLNGVQNAFATQIGANSLIAVAAPSGSPSPNPVPAGIQATFTFNVTNTGPDPATNVLFQATVPTTGIQSPPTATVNTGGGNCTPQALGATLLCNIGTLAVNGVATVSVEVTPSIPVNPLNPQITVSGVASANGAGPTQGPVTQQDSITDFTMSASPSALTVNAGDTASFPITLTPDSVGYNASIAMSESSQPGIVTNPAPTFTVTPVVLSGTGQGTTTLNIATVKRPVTQGSLFRRTSFYAAWLPIGGLSLAGLGIGASRKRRRWLAGAVLGLVAGLILLQPACSSYSTPAGTSGGTTAGTYTITVTGSTASVAGHSCLVTLNVN